jgi:hypothetical protein
MSQSPVQSPFHTEIEAELPFIPLLFQSHQLGIRQINSQTYRASAFRANSSINSTLSHVIIFDTPTFIRSYILTSPQDILRDNMLWGVGAIFIFLKLESA